MNSAAPISLLLIPCPSNRMTSFSRSVSGSASDSAGNVRLRMRCARRRATAGSRWTSPAYAARTAVATSSASASLSTYPDAPASSAEVTFSSSMNEVIVTISVSGRSALMRPIAVTPSMFGISRSIRTTSGSRRRAIATPSEPSAASPTTSMSGCRSRNTLSPVRTTAWSSTMSTRIGASSVTSAPGAFAPLVVGGVVGDGDESSKAGSSSVSGPTSRDDRRDQLRGSEGLANEAMGAAVDGGALEPVRPAHGQDADIGTGRPELGDEAHATIDLGQARVDDDDIGPVLASQGQGGLRLARAPDD